MRSDAQSPHRRESRFPSSAPQAPYVARLPVEADVDRVSRGGELRTPGLGGVAASKDERRAVVTKFGKPIMTPRFSASRGFSAPKTSVASRRLDHRPHTSLGVPPPKTLPRRTQEGMPTRVLHGLSPLRGVGSLRPA